MKKTFLIDDPNGASRLSPMLMLTEDEYDAYKSDGTLPPRYSTGEKH